MSAPDLPVRGRPPRVIVVIKKSSYELYVQESRDSRAMELIAANDMSVARVKQAHLAHRETIERVRNALRELQVEATYYDRGEIERVENADLVVTLGGDGTLLWTSHLVGSDVPMLAINTAPENSVGYFCADSTRKVEAVLGDALAGKLHPTSLTRMQCVVDEHILSKRVLNDILFCHPSPAATSRYILEHDGVQEEQKSSGLWVGPAAGSTGAQRSAGGKVLPIHSEELQFVVREPYEQAGVPYRLAQGLVEPGRSLSICSKMITARVYIDGPYREHTVPIGAIVRLERSSEPFLLLGLLRPKD